MSRRFQLLLLASALLLAASLARAQSELYGGAAFGYSAFKVDVSDEPGGDFEGGALALRQFFGLRVGRYVGVEVGYVDFGTVNDQVTLAPGLTVNDSIETEGYDVALVGHLPLDAELSAFARIGIMRWDSESRLEGQSFSSGADGDDLIGGIGLDYRGANRFHVRLSAEYVGIDFADSWWVVSAAVMYGIPFQF